MEVGLFAALLVCSSVVSIGISRGTLSLVLKAMSSRSPLRQSDR